MRCPETVQNIDPNTFVLIFELETASACAVRERRWGRENFGWHFGVSLKSADLQTRGVRMKPALPDFSPKPLDVCRDVVTSLQMPQFFPCSCRCSASLVRMTDLCDRRESNKNFLLHLFNFMEEMRNLIKWIKIFL